MSNDHRWTSGERVPERSSYRGQSYDRDYGYEDDYDPAYSQARGGQSPGWERGVIEKIATESFKEQRRARRWGVFFKILGFAYVATALLLAGRSGLFDFSFSAPEKHTAIVDVKGPISADDSASAKRIVAGVKAAFEDESTAGVILRINSPGGSPVQSGQVYDEVRRLRAEHEDIPLYAVIGDICASGGYYIAAAADKIYADKGSLVGSIGVRSGGFGFVGTLEKLGIERRLITSGNNKAFLDPFSPVKQEEVAHMETLLANIHEQFKTAVREGRGDALDDSDEIFSGLIWTGDQAIDNGLVDALGSEMTVARDIFDAEKLVNFTPTDGLIDQLTKGVGVSVANRIMSQLSLPKLGE